MDRRSWNLKGPYDTRLNSPRGNHLSCEVLDTASAGRGRQERWWRAVKARLLELSWSLDVGSVLWGTLLAGELCSVVLTISRSRIRKVLRDEVPRRGRAQKGSVYIRVHLNRQMFINVCSVCIYICIVNAHCPACSL